MFRKVTSVVPTRNLAVKSTKRGKKETIDRFLPSQPPQKQKEWEKRGMSKDDFFVKKYSFMSDKRKESLKIKTDREQRAKTAKRDHFKKSRDDQYKRNRDSDDRFDETPRQPLNKNPFNEYLYGRHSVLAALKAKKRYLYDRLILNKQKEQLDEIVSVANSYGIKIDERGSKNDLNILTNNGVHNGVVLETRKLDLPELTSLGAVDSDNGTYELLVWDRELNAKSTINKNIARKNQKTKNPLGIYLDEITDPQNLGNIIRTTFFLGVDFIVTPSHNSARIGPVTSKAAAGALDLMDIYQVNNGLRFMRDVKQGPWSIITTDVQSGSKTLTTNEISGMLAETPVLLVLGSEGSGVRTNLRNLSDFFVSLPKNRISNDTIVDCLNVGTATSILLSKFLD